jgi:hypothetical protein
MLPAFANVAERVGATDYIPGSGASVRTGMPKLAVESIKTAINLVLL